MKIVLDTNAFISCIGKKSPYRNVFDAYLKKDYIFCVSAEILLEYEEKFLMFWGEEVTENLMGRILAGSNTSFHSIYYNFGLVGNDPDDNKFADVYLASNAAYLVTNDTQLLRLNKLIFPPVVAITLQGFSAML
jgi:putative PIN family toxin of toxin-antitoxin system